MAKYMKTEEGYQKIEVINANKMNMNNPVGTGNFSMGRKAGTTVGSNSHAEGNNTTASGSNSHAEGNNTTASGSNSHAEGSRTTASGSNSHAEGNNTTASGWYSHAEGNNTTASNLNSHAEGSGTTASGYASHAEGYDTTASGYASHAEGGGTVASTLNQHVSGSCNILDPSLEGPEFRGRYIHIVGNGLNENSRSNAYTLDWNGNAWFAGDVYVGSTSGTNKDDGSKKLATEDYVNNNVDATLTQPGQAADSAAVGEQLRSLSGKIAAIPSGKDGVGIQSVVQTTTSSEDGGTNVVTVTKTDGTTSTFSVKNGSKGSEGKPGANGYTPVKGTDYWTTADQQTIVDDVLAALPTWEGGNY